ncbi:MAG: hypothetical protein ACKOEO_00560, partial [Planctomycetaceae bacterium]
IDRSPWDVFCDSFGQWGVMMAGGLKHPNLPVLAPFHHPSLALPGLPPVFSLDSSETQGHGPFAAGTSVATLALFPPTDQR